MKKTKKKIGIFIIVLVLCLLGYNDYIDIPSMVDKIVEQNSSIEISKEGTLEVHYIDVGQADSILIKNKDEYMLIDAGNNDDYKIIDEYLKNNNVDRLKYVVATHAHEDHIGSMDYVINNYDVEKVFFSKHTTTTKTFRDFAVAVSNKGLKFTQAKPGEEFYLGDVQFKVLAPNNEKYDDINNYSIVLKATYKNTTFMFTGDAEKEIEKEILDKYEKDIRNIDVLKVAHHGGKTSSTSEFINIVNPEYSIICVGKDNKYGHPNNNVIKRLNNINSKVYRTDLNGNIVILSDGEKIEVK